MKWIYIPTMFVLAFTYTKISFNNFALTSKTPMAPTARKPASNPEVKGDAPFLQKVPLPVFYKNLTAEGLSDFAKVANYKGLIVADPYVENFGFVIDDKKHTKFSILDYSEATQGALFHDVLAHLVSAKSLDKKIKWMPYFEAYKKGLNQESYIYSFYVEKGIENGAVDSARVLEENMTHDFPFEFTKMKESGHRIIAMDKNQISNELKKSFPKIQILDLYEENEKDNNYHLLVRVRPQDKVEWMTLSQMTYDYNQIFGVEENFSFTKRFENLKEMIYANRLDRSLTSVIIDEKFYTIKFKEQFISKINFMDIPSADYHDIIMDQAYALGEIHARSLKDDISDYIQAWATIPSSVIDERAVNVKYKLKDLIEK